MLWSGLSAYIPYIPGPQQLALASILDKAGVRSNWRPYWTKLKQVRTFARGIGISINTRRTNVFLLLVLMLMSCYVAVFTSENRDDIAQAQGSQPFRSPSCLTLRGACVENFV